MQTLTDSNNLTFDSVKHWSTSSRMMHWLIAATLVAAVAMTEHGDIVHNELGWTALGLLLLQTLVCERAGWRNPALLLVTLSVSVVNFSGWIDPEHTAHFTSTFASAVLAGIYVATVVFEAISSMKFGD